MQLGMETYETDSSTGWNNTRTAYFTAGSHVAIILSIFIGSIVSAVFSESEFGSAAAIAVIGALAIYVPASTMISFFSSAIASQSGGNRTICIVGPMVGNVITILLISFLLTMMVDETFSVILEAVFDEGSIISTITMQLSAAFFGTMLANIS